MKIKELKLNDVKKQISYEKKNIERYEKYLISYLQNMANSCLELKEIIKTTKRSININWLTNNMRNIQESFLRLEKQKYAIEMLEETFEHLEISHSDEL